MTVKRGYLVSVSIYGSITGGEYKEPICVFKTKEKAENFISVQDSRDDWHIEPIDAEVF